MNDKERQVLRFVEKCESEGFSPSVSEVCEHMGFSSKSTGFSYLNRLAEKGLLVRLGGKEKKFRTAGLLPSRLPLVSSFSHGIPDIDETTERIYYQADRKLSGREYAFAAPESIHNCGIIKGDITVIEPRDFASDGDTILIVKDDMVSLRRFTPEPTADAPRFAYPEDSGIAIIGRVIGMIRYIR